MEVTYVFSQCINFYFIDDHCQYWLNKAEGTLTSPNFDVNAFEHYYNQRFQFYDHNLNCTWILNADQEYYITLDIEYFQVNDNDTNDIYFTTFLIKAHHSSLVRVTISQFMMDQISNHHQYQN